MVSGAGHDAHDSAERGSAAMIFLRTPAGSATTRGGCRVADVAKAIECGLQLLDQLASSAGIPDKDVPCIISDKHEVPTAQPPAANGGYLCGGLRCPA